MKFKLRLSLLPIIAAMGFAPISAQNTAPLSYDERITCSALLFLSSQAAQDSSMERQFAAHHLTKAIAISGKEQPAAIADTEARMETLRPAWDRGDTALMETFSSCIATVISEFER